jgi:Toprim domain-containing protein
VKPNESNAEDKPEPMTAASHLVAEFTRQPQFQCLSGSTLALLESRNLLQLIDKGKWHYGDDNNGGSRYLKGGQWKECDTSGDDWHKLAGLQDVIAKNRKQVAFVLEGVKDALAAAELFNRLGLLPTTGIVAALGAGYRPIESEIASLRGRKVVLIGDADPTGRECIARVSAALVRHEVEHIAAIWHKGAKDVFELVELCASQKINFARAFFSLTQFFSSLPSLHTPQPLNHSTPSTIQPFISSHPSTQVEDGSSVEAQKKSVASSDSSVGVAQAADFNPSTQVELPRQNVSGDGNDFNPSTQVASFVAQAPSMGNRCSFLLAHALRSYEERSGTILSDEIVEAVFKEWFTRSRSMLPADADFEKSHRRFLDQMGRVRYTDSALKAACERANNSPLPDLPGLLDTARRVAALYRELQRAAGRGRSFICPVNILVDWVPFRWPEQARLWQARLEKEGVIECAERGAPHVRGKRGKSTLWRYMKPL